MASDTAPAAVPHPGNPPEATPNPAARPGGFAGLLAPVTPARTDTNGFHLNPGQSDTSDAILTSASSADIPHDTAPKTETDTGKAAAQQQSVVRAWLLAGAERWKKGADARNKRLDVAKARAMAFKEARTVTVNRAEKIAGGSTGTNTQSKTDKSGAGRGTGAGGRSNSAGHKSPSGKDGPGASGSGHRGGTGHRGQDTHKGKGGGRGTDRHASADKSSHSGKGPTGGSPSTGADKATRNSPKPAKDTRTFTDSGKAPKTSTQTCGDSSGISPAKDKKPKPTKNEKDTPAKPGPKAVGDHRGPAGPSGKETPRNAPTPGDKTADPKKNPDAKGGTKNTPSTGPKHTPTAQDKTDGRRQATQSGKAPHTSQDSKNGGKGAWKGPHLDLQPSRETGYRDGTRIGRIEAHMGAYRHGLTDGRADIKQQAAREKARLDKAHTDRTQPHRPAQQPAPPTVIPPKPANPPKVQAPPAEQQKDPSVPQPTSPQTARPGNAQPQTTTGPKPIPVTGIDRDQLYLGPGATRPTISRKEVRTLRHFQSILEDKAASAARAVDRWRIIEQHAIDQAAAVVQLVEQAKSVQGGDRLIGKLTRAEEQANAQAAKAAEGHKRAVRALDHSRALAANVQTRYGDMYKAIVNSPDTVPADLAYYREMANA